MCSFFVRLESIEKTNKFGSRWKTKFFWPFDVGPSSVDRYILVKTHVLQSTNKTPLHMSWDSVLIILLNYHSNFSVVSFFIHFHLCIVLVFAPELFNHWRVHFFFPGEGFSTQAKTNTGISSFTLWGQFHESTLGFIWIDLEEWLNQLHPSLGIAILCSHILFGVKSIFQQYQCALERTYLFQQDSEN